MRLRVKNKILLLVIFIFISLDPPGVAQQYEPETSLAPNDRQDKLFLRSIEYVYQDSFSAAYAVLDTMINEYPDYWPANVFKIGVLFTEMNDSESKSKADQFHALIDTTEKGIEEYLKKYPDDKWAHFFKGIAMGYWALYEGNHGSWLKAIFKGLAAGKHYSKAIELDSTFYEAYLGLGSLNYWRSAKLGIARKLPFIPDRREEGIRQIKLAIDSSRYSSLPAQTGLAWIYYNKKEYRKALHLMNDLMNRGYRGRQVLWPRGLAYFKIGNSKGVIACFSKIKDGLELQGNQNYYNIGLCNYYLGLAHYWSGKYATSLSYLNALLDQPVDKDVAKRLKQKYDRAEHYKDIIKDAVAERAKRRQGTF